jgi:hypothetical protein
MRPQPTVLAALLVAAALPGCGGTDDKQTTGAVQDEQRGILATVDALQAATRGGDSAKVCSRLFTKSLVRSIEKASRHACAAEVEENLFKPGESISVGRDIVVKGDAGTAVIREQTGSLSTLYLVKQGGAWRIDRVTPRG